MNEGITSPDAEHQLQEVIAFIRAILCDPVAPSDMPDLLKSNPDFLELYEQMASVREGVRGISEGDLSVGIQGHGFVVGALKALQANLRHLTWQTKRVAQGDFTQKVDFLGEFSDSFNIMVRALSEARAELERIALTDPLTSLANRRRFFEAGRLEVERSRRFDASLSVLALDLDFFKKVNDTYGHQAGDLILQGAANVFQLHVRGVDLVGRIGGEEFAILLPETNLSGSIVVAENILTNIRKLKIELEDSQTIGITSSIGIACLQPDDQTFEKLLQRADIALYAAKDSGRNRYCVFQPEMQKN